MPFKDYYATLEVSPTASAEEIRRSFHRLALKYHPDRNAGSVEAEDRFKQINEAYQVLSDPQKRLRYDALYRDRHPTPSTLDTRSVGGQPNNPGNKSSAPAHSPNDHVVWPCPPSIQIQKDEAGVVIEFTRQSPPPSMEPFMQVLAFLAFFIVVPGLSSGILLVAIIGVAIWLCFLGMFIYVNQAITLNKTRIVVNSLHLRVDEIPLPIGPGILIPTKSLRTVFYDLASSSNLSAGYHVLAITDSWSEQRLLDRLSQQEAAFVVQELKRFLQILAV